ncbi:MAG: ribosome recycling factor [Pseudomonadales bacterium]|nr:ribosome recycling factor [Candidatus Woesebacteria bacterium]MCB9800880.1 ribosome recycling factor [Pseudomonadales bacterium]
MSNSFTQITEKLDKALEHVRRDIATLRTGRATTQILDPVMVDAYGAKMKIVEVASVQVPDPTLLVVSPWDKSLLVAVERAIATADLNLNPVVNGDIIRIAIAPLTEEKRKEMVKSLAKKIEAGRVMLRTIRTDAKKDIESQEGNDGISEDDIKRDVESLEEMIQEYNTKLDEIYASKEKDLMTV